MLPDIIVDELKNLPETLASLVEREAARAIINRDFFAVALPGGAVATTFFPQLSQLPLNWSKTHFFWGDERAVPPSHPDSNFGVADTLWFKPARVPETSIHRMPADMPNLDAAAQTHAQDLATLTGTPPLLDLVLLGVGPDGHVCSLFPGHALLQETSLWVAAVKDSPKPPPRRLTLTLPVLAAAGHVVVAAMGQAKAAVVQEAIEDPRSMLRVALAAKRAPRVTYLLDREAASRLHG
jgi:6-phosphogluconolactonase